MGGRRRRRRGAWARLAWAPAHGATILRARVRAGFWRCGADPGAWRAGAQNGRHAPGQRYCRACGCAAALHTRPDLLVGPATPFASPGKRPCGECRARGPRRAARRGGTSRPPRQRGPNRRCRRAHGADAPGCSPSAGAPRGAWRSRRWNMPLGMAGACRGPRRWFQRCAPSGTRNGGPADRVPASTARPRGVMDGIRCCPRRRSSRVLGASRAGPFARAHQAPPAAAGRIYVATGAHGQELRPGLRPLAPARPPQHGELPRLACLGAAPQPARRCGLARARHPSITTPRVPATPRFVPPTRRPRRCARARRCRGATAPPWAARRP
jgi:hypothetical protein